MLGEEKLINFTKTNYQKKITKVNERVYHFWAMDIVMQLRLLGKLQLY